MQVEDINGAITTVSPVELGPYLIRVRRGAYGAFLLWDQDQGGPSLSISINGDVAYLHYWSGAKGHAGFQATGMTPPGCPEQVHFLQAGGVEADSFDLPGTTLVGVEIAYRAAREFLATGTCPTCIRWLEL